MDDWKSLVLQDFKHWLEDLPHDAVADSGGEPECDLHTLFAEFAALRQEVRLQSREQARVVRDLARVAEVGETTTHLLRRHAEGLSSLEEQVRQAAERRCLLPFLDVRDALVRGRDAAARVAAGARGLFRRPPPGMEGVMEGYKMALERFDRALAVAGVRVIETVGRGFDAQDMRAVATRTVDNVPDGVVVEEFLSGFTRGNEVLRPAEVAVNRLQDARG